MGLPDDPEVNHIQDYILLDNYSPLFFKARAFLMSLRNQAKHLIDRGRL